eukprot:m.98146 g.98146  ORF g.98146 m.98146 type:complete len:782 (+) comp27040_c0_seq1:482-2827(+)
MMRIGFHFAVCVVWTLLFCTNFIALADQDKISIFKTDDDFVIGGIRFPANSLFSFYHQNDDKNHNVNDRRRSDAVYAVDIDDVVHGKTTESNVMVDWIVLATDAASATTVCEAATASSNAAIKCINVFHHVFNGVGISATLSQVVQLLAPLSTSIRDASPALSVELEPADLDLENIKMFDTQLDATWGLDHIDASHDGDFVHSSGAGEGVTVFVVDTGVRCTHEELTDRCIPGWTAYTHDNNGEEPTRSITTCDPTDFACALDDHGHGTHCAGTIAGTKYGVAKSATIVAVKAMSHTGSGSSLDVLAGMDWILSQKHAKPNTPMVISMSIGLGNYRHTQLDNSIAVLRAAGVIASVSAGNTRDDACFSSPGGADASITVGATDRFDTMSSFSNFGRCIDIWAPGSTIKSAYIQRNGGTRDDRYAISSGTSMACPHVSGVLAQILSSRGNLSPDDSERYLKSSATTNALSGIPFYPPSVNLFLSNVIKDTPPPTTPAPIGLLEFTQAATIRLEIDQGDIFPGETMHGDSSNPGESLIDYGNKNNHSSVHQHIYTLNIASTAIYTITTCTLPPATFDTTLTLFSSANSSSSPSEWREIEYNDDARCGMSSSSSLISLSLTPGLYRILIEGYDEDESGRYALNVHEGDATFKGSLAVGDSTRDNTLIPGFNVRGYQNYDHYFAINITSASTVTFSLCGNANDTTRHDTLADTVLRLYDSNANRLVKNEDACDRRSRITYDFVSPMVYYIYVEGKYTDGQYHLAVFEGGCSDVCRQSGKRGRRRQ